MKLILKDVKIYGYDPSKECNKAEKISKNGKPFNVYSLRVKITEKDKNIIDQYLYNKVDVNAEGEFLFWLNKPFDPIPLFDSENKLSKEPINDTFIANVSLELEDKEHNGEIKRFCECKGIKFIKKSESETGSIIIQKREEKYEDIFPDEEEITIPATQVQQAATVAPLEPDPMNVDAGNAGDDLPF